MGNFYVNFSVQGTDSQRIADGLRRASCKAIVTPPVTGYVVVCEQESDTQDTDAIDRIGALLSREADAPVLAVLNHDDDILCYWLFENGLVIDSYNSNPDYFGEIGDEENNPGGDAHRLCDVLSRSSVVGEVEAILRDDKYVFAMERHDELARALGLPSCSVGAGYRYAESGEWPDEMNPDHLIHVS